MVSRSFRNRRPASGRRKKRGTAFAKLAVFSSAAAAGVLVFTVPVINGSSSAFSAAFTAAKASAMLSVGDVFPAEENIQNIQNVQTLENITADKPLPEVPKKTAYTPNTHAALFTVDDREMLSWGELEIPNSSDEERIVPDEKPDAGPKPYPESLESHDGIITFMTYGHMNGEAYVDLDIAGQVRNVTSVSGKRVLEESRLLPDFTVEKNGEPQVLIMHTHATESYEPYERDFYDASFNSRTTDRSMNMAAVGDKIAEQLETAGIGVIHDTTLHDYPSYNGSYDLSRETVQKYLDEYPSIKIVLDVHRDAIERESGERIAPLAAIDGKNAAQVMIICGCDDGTMNMPNCMKNLRFACLLQRQMESDYPGLTRPVLFDYRKYNQDLTTGSILIEMGGHANSIEQAEYSGELVGKSLARCLEELT